MSQGIESHIDWAAPSKSHAGTSSSSRPDRQPSPSDKRKVLDTLLGKNNLSAAADVSGDDPYNATGRHFRR